MMREEKWEACLVKIESVEEAAGPRDYAEGGEAKNEHSAFFPVCLVGEVPTAVSKHSCHRLYQSRGPSVFQFGIIGMGVRRNAVEGEES